MNRILVVHLSGIGNLITVLPLIRKLKRIYPNAHLDFLLHSKRGGEDILKHNPNISNVYYLDPTSGSSKLSKLYILYKKAKELPKYDLALTTYPNQGIYSAMLMYLVAKNRTQHKYKYGSFLLSYAPHVERKHFVKLNLDLLPFESIDEDYKYDYYMSPEENLFAEKFIKHNAGKRFLIGIHPGSYSDMIFKRWKTENWNKLMDLLNKNFKNIHFFVFIGPNDNLEEEFAYYRNVTLVKNLPLRNVIAIISKLNLFVSNDSGLAHVASLFSIPQVVLFGATDYVYSSPFSKKAIIITPNKYEPFYVPHKGIIRKPNNFINLIEPDKVFNVIKKLVIKEKF